LNDLAVENETVQVLVGESLTIQSSSLKNTKHNRTIVTRWKQQL